MSKIADDVRALHEVYELLAQQDSKATLVKLVQETQARKKVEDVFSLAQLKIEQLEILLADTMPPDQFMVSISSISPRSQKILLSCSVAQYDGNYAFRQLLDLLKHADEFLIDQIKDVFITTDHVPKNLQVFSKKLMANGFRVALIDNIFSFNRIFAFASKGTIQKMAYIINLNGVSTSSDQNSIMKTINEAGRYSGIIHIADEPFAITKEYKHFNVPTLSIPVGYGTNTHSSTHSLSRTYSTFFFLTQEDRTTPADQLSIVLSKKENQALCLALLGKAASTDFIQAYQSQDIKKAKEICAIFLKNNLFVPSYFQSDGTSIINLMSIVAESPLSPGYSAITFLTNRVNLVELKNRVEKGYLSKKIGTLIITTDNHAQTNIEKDSISITNSHASPQAKTITICSGFGITNEDYSVFLHTAPIFAGCGNHTSLGQAISNGLIPLFGADSFTQGFWEDAASFDKQFILFQRIQKIVGFDNIDDSNVSFLDYAKWLTKEFNVSEEAMPDIVKQWTRAVRSGESFTIEGNTYRPDYNEYQRAAIMSIFMEHFEKSTTWQIMSTGCLSVEEKSKLFQDIKNMIMDCFSTEKSKGFMEFIESQKIDESLVTMTRCIKDAINTKKPFKLIDTKGEQVTFDATFDQSNELMDIFDDHFPLIKRQSLETQISDIALLLDGAFFKQWIELCERMKREKNLHSTLPKLIEEFFLEPRPSRQSSDKPMLPQFTSSVAADATASTIVSVAAPAEMMKRKN